MPYQQKQPPIEPAKGSFNQCSDSPHLCADDITHDVALEISGATKEEVTSPNNKKKTMICLSFKGAKKKLPLNKTNGKIIAKIAGSPAVENWIGANVILYRSYIKAFGDPELPCIRVRDSTKK